MDKMERRYPVGIQTFEKIRKENYLYIDKTDLVWHLTKVSPFIFLSRPRRFGKSLLTTTLDSYFKGQREGFYEHTFWLIFNMLNVYAQTQVKCAGGRVDFVVQMPEAIYVFELKVNGTAQEAIEQINSHGYALPYSTDRRKVVKIGAQFDRDTMTVGEYIIEL